MEGKHPQTDIDTSWMTEEMRCILKKKQEENIEAARMLEAAQPSTVLPRPTISLSWLASIAGTWGWSYLVALHRSLLFLSCGHPIPVIVVALVTRAYFLQISSLVATFFPILCRLLKLQSGYCVGLPGIRSTISPLVEHNHEYFASASIAGRVHERIGVAHHEISEIKSTLSVFPVPLTEKVQAELDRFYEASLASYEQVQIWAEGFTGHLRSLDVLLMAPEEAPRKFALAAGRARLQSYLHQLERARQEVRSSKSDEVRELLRANGESLGAMCSAVAAAEWKWHSHHEKLAVKALGVVASRHGRRRYHDMDAALLSIGRSCRSARQHWSEAGISLDLLLTELRAIERVLVGLQAALADGVNVTGKVAQAQQELRQGRAPASPRA